MHRWKAKILLFPTSKKLRTFSPKPSLETREKRPSPNLLHQPGTPLGVWWWTAHRLRLEKAERAAQGMNSNGKVSVVFRYDEVACMPIF